VTTVAVYRFGRGKQRRQSRKAGVLYSALALAVVLAVAAMSLSVSQSPPPAIAELAPAPVERITDAPLDQSSELGTGDGGGGGGGIATTTTTAPILQAGVTTTIPPIRPPRVRRCVGDPPRQTEDPQSPPCVSWTGTDNGGATTKGVTAEEIRVAVPTGDGNLNRHYLALQSYFNSRYELYGRKLRLVPFKFAGIHVQCSAMKADAIKVADELDAFASIFYANQRGAETCYYDELARRGVMSMQSAPNGPPSGGEASLEAMAPYQWSYVPSLDKIMRGLGDLICKSMASGPAIYARGLQREAPVRKFGLVQEIPARGAAPVDRTPLESVLRGCNVPVNTLEQDAGSGDNAHREGIARQAIIRFKNDGVTSVICLCESYYLANLFGSASLEGFFPEWLIQNYQSQDNDGGMNDLPFEEQKRQVFGLRSFPKILPRAENAYWAALREADPTFPPGTFVYSPVYWDLLVLASGIQMAGPALTPQAFQSGLFRTKFPNPGCGGPPLYQGCVGFGPGNHTMVQDFMLVWYDRGRRPRDTDPEFGGHAAGGYCYVNDGRRYRPGQLPSSARFFDTCQ